MRRSLVIAATLLVTAMALPVAAQQYPTRPVQFVIPFATGGPTDTAIRVIQPQLAASLGVPVVLVNKPGGGGAVGMDGVAKARWPPPCARR
jgi:tripartite-type tricarboxylate transporter receptor subunit TctC